MRENRRTEVRIVLHIPHSSMLVPSVLRESFLLTETELHQELLRMTDAYTHELFQCELPGVVSVRYPISRLVVDAERFEDDRDEVMSEVGMGVIYTRTSSGQALRKPPTPAEREALLYQYYRPHHQALTRAVEASLASSGKCLVIDCHSFPQKPLPYELDQDGDRPDICIGSDEFHSPPDLRDELVSIFKTCGYSVAVNRPFSGALVPSRYYQRHGGVQSVMIELNRALYMDESTGEKTGRFTEIGNVIAAVLQQLASDY